MAFAAPMLMFAGAAGLSAFGQIRQGQAAQAAAQYNAQVDRTNAAMAEQQAQSQAMVQQRQASMHLGKMRADLAANGVDTTEGSPLEILAQSSANAEMDRQNIVYNGRVRSTAFRNNAQLQDFEGRNALENGYLSAAGTLLQGTAKAFASSGAGSSLSANG